MIVQSHKIKGRATTISTMFQRRFTNFEHVFV